MKIPDGGGETEVGLKNRLISQMSRVRKREGPYIKNKIVRNNNIYNNNDHVSYVVTSRD